MAWTHVRQNYGTGMTEQWILRAQNAPICSLRRGETTGAWQASLLRLTGISAVLHVTAGTLEQAQRSCESELREMGWSI